MTSSGSERGSLSIEYVIIVPLLMLVFSLIAAYGTKANVDGNLQAATRDAARAASQAGSRTQGIQVAKKALADAMGAHCQLNTLDVDGSPNANYESGATITVHTTCTWNVSTILGTIAMTPTAQFSSMIDPSRVLG